MNNYRNDPENEGRADKAPALSGSQAVNLYRIADKILPEHLRMRPPLATLFYDDGDPIINAIDLYNGLIRYIKVNNSLSFRDLLKPTTTIAGYTFREIEKAFSLKNITDLDKISFFSDQAEPDSLASFVNAIGLNIHDSYSSDKEAHPMQEGTHLDYA